MVASSVDELRAGIGALGAVELDDLTDAELDAELIGLLRERHRLDAAIARRAGRWDARSVWIGDGSRSAAARLSRDGQVALSTARDVVRRARAITSMPRAASAWEAGAISADQIDMLAHARSGDREQVFVRDESMLVTHAATLRHAQFVKTLNYWRERADAEVGADGTPPDPVGRLSYAETLDGTIVGEFSLDAVRGAAVVEGLRRIERELRDADRRDGVVRTKAERLGAALYEMAVRAHTAPKDGKRPEPLVVILAGESTLEELCELSTGTVIAEHLIVPHLCRAMMQTIVFDGADRVVAGSKQRTFRGLLRRAIQVRDRHCQHASGCDAPISECDVNHVTAWRDSHRTHADDGNLECTPHNRIEELHARASADVIDAARWRREEEALTRQRIDELIAQHPIRPPPTAA